MSSNLLLSMAEDPTIRVIHPELPSVRAAVFDFVYASSLLAGAVFTAEESVIIEEVDTDTDTDDADTYKYGTTKGDVLDKLAEGRLVGSLAVVTPEGKVEIIPPIIDKKKERRVLEGLSAAATKAYQKSQS